ncbi:MULTISPECIES: winged helix-turn-helix domain-containing protein [unclassified Streptomyces]|uniref:winged helix-turn-helix domain-containing protein n=1 Tax=unclassified Streptomyces TaxID=2593676 RepID=UPI0037F25242
MFHVGYPIQGVRELLVRNGWSCQVPARRRALERDDAVVETRPGRRGYVRGWKHRGGPRCADRLRGRGWDS